MHAFAQTNLQLINQLQNSGYPPAELKFVAIAYELAMRLFTGRFRASGKSFIAHLVGTASILGSLRTPSTIVAAGLTHAAYTAGDFGDGDTGMTNARRESVRAVLGTESEEYVARYTRLRWSKDTIQTIHDGLETLDPLDRDVLLVRLANELEEFLDLGLLYSGDKKREIANSMDRDGPLMIAMTEKLGFPQLARDFVKVFEETAGAHIPAILSKADGPNFSFVVAPQSYQRLMETIARRLKAKESLKT